jgi:transcriptional regulator with XRE-family HTH domain
MKLRTRIDKALLTMSREDLAARAGVSLSTVTKIINGHVPLPKNAFRLAKAIECDDEEARRIASECSSLRARKAG